MSPGDASLGGRAGFLVRAAGAGAPSPRGPDTHADPGGGVERGRGRDREPEKPGDGGQSQEDEQRGQREHGCLEHHAESPLGGFHERGRFPELPGHELREPTHEWRAPRAERRADGGQQRGDRNDPGEPEREPGEQGQRDHTVVEARAAYVDSDRLHAIDGTRRGSVRCMLDGRVVVVTDADAARAVAEAGGSVVLLAGDSDADGALAPVATELERAGLRVAHFSGTVTDADDRAALAEMIAELFPPSTPIEPA